MPHANMAEADFSGSYPSRCPYPLAVPRARVPHDLGTSSSPISSGLISPLHAFLGGPQSPATPPPSESSDAFLRYTRSRYNADYPHYPPAMPPQNAAPFTASHPGISGLSPLTAYHPSYPATMSHHAPNVALTPGQYNAPEPANIPWDAGPGVAQYNRNMFSSPMVMQDAPQSFYQEMYAQNWLPPHFSTHPSQPVTPRPLSRMAPEPTAHSIDARLHNAIENHEPSQHSAPAEAPQVPVSNERSSQNVDFDRAGMGSRRLQLPTLMGLAGRSDRSASPRTSTRRDFDRFSEDLTAASNQNEPSEHMPRPARRARHRRPGMPPELQARYNASMMPSYSQVESLKDKLKHFLLSELPADSSPTCDICQKDYSAKHVEPCEEDEVAVQLPCNHMFGEWCISQWFETCQKQKNKITCPMCRTQLIEPRRHPQPDWRLQAMFDRQPPMGMRMISPERELLQEMERNAFVAAMREVGRNMEGSHQQAEH